MKLGTAEDVRAAVERVMTAYVETGADPELPTFDQRLTFQRLLNAEGLAAPGWPVQYGGRGASVRECLLVDAELARVGAPMAAGILGLANVGRALIAFGTDEQRRSLPHILDGSEMWCQGFSEPGAGSDLAHLTTRARIDGDTIVIDGQKIWTSNGMEATHCMLLARTDPAAAAHRGISAILVPLDRPGITRRPITTMAGESEFAEVFFTDVVVPLSAVLGPLHDGWRVTTETLKHERAGVLSRAAELSAIALTGLATITTASHADPIMVDELTRRYVDARILGLLGEQTLTRAERGLDIGSEQALIKLAWGLLNRALATSLFDGFGSAAVAGALPAVTHGLLTTRSSTIAAGTTEVLKNLVADRVLALPR